jgi:phage-related baseplate assembly protein
VADFVPRTASEWLAVLVANFTAKAGFTPAEGTTLHAMLYGLAVALAASDVQRSLIFWEVHPELATRLGLELLADDLGVSYSGATTDNSLRAAVKLARTTAVGTRAWYESLPAMLYPSQITSALAAKNVFGPGSVRVMVYYNGGPVDDATVEALQSDFNGDDYRPLTDRVTVSTPAPGGVVGVA